MHPIELVSITKRFKAAEKGSDEITILQDLNLNIIQGRSTAIMVAVAGLAVAAFYGTRNWMKGRDAAASAALVKMASPNSMPGGAGLLDEQEEAVATYGSTKAGPKMKIVLAKSYFDAERYEEALAEYERMDGSAPEGFEDVPSVGRAECLEALGRLEEAVKSYDAFAEAKPKSFLALTARLGAARCVAQLGDKAKALERLAAVKETVGDDESAKTLVESAEALVKRWEKREKTTLFDAADAAAKQIEADAAAVPAEAPVEVPAEIPAAEAPAAEPAPVPAAE